MIGFCPLASGSKGNCLYLGTKKTKILIDAGISARMIEQRLLQLGVDIRAIDALIVTHEHADHIKAVVTLGLKYRIPIFANADTAKILYETLDQNLRFKIFSTGELFEFGDMEFHPFSVQHDAIDPVAFSIRMDGLKIGICTDLGFASSLVIKQLQSCDYLYVEANHQPSMVHACNRPDVYKQRVLSKQGHLSNEQCAELLLQVMHGELKHIYLAHLSQECNHPDLARKIVLEKLGDWQGNLSIAHQDIISDRIYFS